jgi:selenocysteine lyase/cysteine desulfurase
VAVGCASNAVGTITPIKQIVAMAHAQGAEVFLDAVHYAPHALLDVAAWGCDFLACSAYKFFGPHVGVMWGRRERLAELAAAKLRPAPDALPGKWMTGTQNHEGIAGTLAAIDYLADVGRMVRPAAANRRERLAAAFVAIGDYERQLAARLLAGLGELAEVTVLGIADPTRLAERVPTVSILHRRFTPAELAHRLGERGIYTWHGNFYALSLSESLGLEPDGMLRIGLVHYNTFEEIARLLAALRSL